ncbi:MAG: hypothetical protein DRP02_01160 [Candidatus Gerdarchaeota archaeon]|nr:MAG: hypothetical protein DRP02_01160 [Candidatus Gerdarchaeota archaeon]
MANDTWRWFALSASSQQENFQFRFSFSCTMLTEGKFKSKFVLFLHNINNTSFMAKKVFFSKNEFIFLCLGSKNKENTLYTIN